MSCGIRFGSRAFLATLSLLLLCGMTASPARPDERLDRLPEKYKKWLEEEVVYIITDREKDAFLELQSAEEWEAFIEAFWRKRDPDPLTPVNEFKEEHYKRIEHANRELGRESAVPGWMTDRGKMYIILGKPHDRESFTAVPALYPSEVWFYQADNERGLPPLYLLFFQEGNAGPYRLFNHVFDSPEDLMPAQPFGTEDRRREAYDFLEGISPDLAHATITMRADEGTMAGLIEPTRSALDFQTLLTDIYRAPYRRVDTSYVDAAKEARGLVESEYLFNYVPNSGVANVIPGPAGTSFVHYSIEIEPQHMTLAKDGPTYYTSLDLRGELVTTGSGKTVYQFTKEPYMNMTESQFREVMNRPFSYRDMFPLASGDYTFRLVLKNRARSEYTFFETDLHVPPATEEPLLGDPVLLYETAPIASPEAAQVYRTYQLGSLKLEPNARRAYPLGAALVAYIPVAHVSEAHQIRLRLVPREESIPAVSLQATGATVTRIGSYGGSPVIESLSLAGLVGGRYRLTAELLAPSGEILATRSADFDVTPRTSLLKPWVLRETIDGERTGLVWSSLADQYLRLDEPAKAREACLQALKDDPNLIGPRVILARFHLDESQPVEAIKLLEAAYARSKDDVEVLLTLGDAHFQVKNYSRAAELFEAALPLRRPTTSLLNALGICHAQMGDPQKAIDYLERSLEMDPNQDAIKSLVEKLKTPSHW